MTHPRLNYKGSINMNQKKIIICGTFVLGLLLTATVVLTSQIILLNKEKKQNLTSITILQQNLKNLQSQVTSYREELAKIGFYHFKDNVFRTKYPEFSEVTRIVFKKSREYGFNPYHIMALIQVESNFQPYAVSPTGSYGLMQVNYAVWKNHLDIDFKRIFNKEYNIDLGLKILKQYYQESSGNIFVALHRYNNGYKLNNFDYNLRIVATQFFFPETPGITPQHTTPSTRPNDLSL